MRDGRGTVVDNGMLVIQRGLGGDLISQDAKGMFLLVKVVMLDVLEGELMDRELNRKDITGMIHRQRQTCKMEAF
jgi:hypothetical protein